MGDFANNGLLRWLCGITSGDNLPILSLGIVQYLNHDDGPFGNVQPFAEWEECDQQLFETLQNLVNEENRNVRAAEYQQLLPDTLPFNECRCDFASRANWLDDAVAATLEASLIFLNPDNGIREEHYQGNNDSPKHAYLEDLGRFFNRDKSLVVYHHFRRNRPYIQQVEDVRALLLENFPGIQIWAFRFGGRPPFRGQRPIPGRAYFLLTHDNGHPVLNLRLDSFVARSPLYSPPSFLFMQM